MPDVSQNNLSDYVPKNLHSLTSPIKISKKEDVHLWLINLTLPEFFYKYFEQSLLSEYELVKAKSFKFKHHKLKYLASHGYLRLILSRYINCCPNEINYGFGKYGKPFLKNSPYKLCFNMSHSGEMALYAITLDVDIGVDIEIIKQNLNTSELAEDVFTAQEKSIFKTIEESKKSKAFYDIWTLKEAYSKAIGEGLNFPLNELDVFLHAYHQYLDPWSLYSLDIPNYSAAVSIKRKNNTLHYLEMDAATIADLTELKDILKLP